MSIQQGLRLKRACIFVQLCYNGSETIFHYNKD